MATTRVFASALPSGSRRTWRARLRDSWPVVRPIAVQISLAAIVATALALLLGHHTFPVFAPLFAVTTMELICAPRHRRAVEMVFGVAVGALLTAIVGPSWSTPHVLIDAAVGAGTALAVAWFTTPRAPISLVNQAVEPLLTSITGNLRALSLALRERDTAAAGSAVYALVETDVWLQRLEEALFSVRRSAFLLRWTTGQQLAPHTTTATEIGYAVRHVRNLAQHAWWDLLRSGEQVPIALPQALDALADGTGMLREELDREGCLRNVRPLLVSAAQWVTMLREEHLSLAAAGVAASADAAVQHLLVATGVPPAEADALQHRRTPVAA
ncbi:hypothetical protein AB0H43_30795 [Hamadaea sp. NPDC050747]|uniref:hypothetical protein n=1 Tax=Hamadaea sp. NPDC050747 TaxID=3155789 RepID=UPI0033E5F28C